MAFKVIKPFRDKEDKNTSYEVGDAYPKGSFKPTKKRFDELSELHPQYKAPFIQEVKEEVKKTTSKKE